MPSHDQGIIGERVERHPLKRLRHIPQGFGEANDQG